MQHHIFSFFLLSLLCTTCRNESQKGVPVPPKAVAIVTTQKDSDTVPALDKDASIAFEAAEADAESKERVIWQKPDLVINLLGNLQDKTIADIGAGTGYFAFRLIPKAKKVIAIDIDKQFINFMDSIKVRLSDAAQARFETRLTKPDNPRLQPKEADIVILVDTYGYISNRDKYLAHIKRGLKPGGDILIIDFKKENLPEDVSGSFTISLSTVVKELETAGFIIKKVDNTALDYQYIITASSPL
jgi:SAM-dependent methyltransferase